MKYEELLEKYTLLSRENRRLAEENERLKAQLGMAGFELSRSGAAKAAAEKNIRDDRSTGSDPFPSLTNTSDSDLKIKLFMSLFRGRDDVYAKLWVNKNKTKKGYSPVCLNQWKVGVCGKPKTPCKKCSNQLYAALDEQAVESHLRGNIVAGVYPMLPDETCRFLAMDFDEEDWQKDISMVRVVCTEFDIPITVERSRSGNGGHAWFFFENKIPAATARKFGAALLTASMNRRHEIRFKSYDRLFPSQDTMPRGGLGNLIALPFQKSARRRNNSVFVDANFEPHGDQWAYLSSIRKLSEDRVEHLIQELCGGRVLGVLKVDEEEPRKPWKTAEVSLQKSDFPERLRIVKSNMLYIPKTSISQRALNRLKRLASFKNPMFYKQQAMHLSTRGFDRVISCAEEIGDYLGLPRGCEKDLCAELETLGVHVTLVDRTNRGEQIDIEFKGSLRDEQPRALEHLLRHDIGILSGTTAFGKTVVAIKLIAERRVNTLILVNKVSLLSQWKNRLSEFLIVNEPLRETTDVEGKKRGRKKKRSVVGQLGGGKNALNGIVDVATMQSIGRIGEVKDCVKNYGMIIADECHHASAFNYGNILKTADARYICGLTATPTRKDGHHPILYMHCGPIRYRDDAKKQAENRPFDHYVIPRFTALRAPLDCDEKDVSIQDLYSEIVDAGFRNEQIVEDVIDAHRRGGNCLVLTLRTAHVELLSKRLRDENLDVVTLTGGMGAKATREAFHRITDTPVEKNLLIVATGAFIGEGFDEPRLDSLFLAMPISWKGLLQQYAGRLHRLFEKKKEVCIYDYVDIHVKMLERMYQKRLSGYASMGYRTRAEDITSSPIDIIFDKDNFLPVFSRDVACAKKEIMIVSPFVRKRRSTRIARLLKSPLEKRIRVIVVTRPVEDFKEKNRIALQQIIDMLEGNKIDIVFKSRIHQKFAIIDHKTVWYGSINLLSYGVAQESIMRLESASIASELFKSMENGV